MPFHAPRRLVFSCGQSLEGQEWLERLPIALEALQAKWSLSLGPPFEDASCAWVAPVELDDGSSAILKIGMPHMEGRDELKGLRFWGGEPTVRLLRADEERAAMLLECCVPGTSLRALPESEQDVVIAGLLRRLWREPPIPHEFRSLADMTRHWSSETVRDVDKWADAGLVRAGLGLLDELSRPEAAKTFLLATDLHAGNVLRSQRHPWLAIDPKPFVGDPCYDAIRRFTDLLGVSWKRVELWMFARAAAEPRRNWNEDAIDFAKRLAP